jgi:hypothetical protein
LLVEARRLMVEQTFLRVVLRPLCLGPTRLTVTCWSHSGQPVS